MTNRDKRVPTESTHPDLSGKDMGSWSFSPAAECSRREAWATELRRRLDTQFAPREGDPPNVESQPMQVDEHGRQFMRDVAALAAHDFWEGDEGWYRPLLAELNTLSGDAETTVYRWLIFGIFVAADLADPAQSFKTIFGDRMRGWKLALPSDAAQRAHSLNNLKWLFESLVNNDSVTAAHAMDLHLAGVQRTPSCTRPPPLLAFPASYLFFYGRLDGPE